MAVLVYIVVDEILLRSSNTVTNFVNIVAGLAYMGVVLQYYHSTRSIPVPEVLLFIL